MKKETVVIENLECGRIVEETWARWLDKGGNTWWNHLEARFPSVADKLKQDRRVEISLEIWRQIQALPGFETPQETMVLATQRMALNPAFRDPYGLRKRWPTVADAYKAMGEALERMTPEKKRQALVSVSEALPEISDCQGEDE